MLKKLMKGLNGLISIALIFQLMGCGTIMYPERKGQKSGKIDAGVAVLDGIGLLFFLIPGIIAYAVDFSNGTIYLPGTSRSSLDNKDIREVKFDPRNASMADIANMIRKETGYDVRPYQDTMTVVELESSADMLTHFAAALPGIPDARLVLVNK